MNSTSITTRHLEYLQRSDFQSLSLSIGQPMTQAPPEQRRLDRVAGIGRFEKMPSLAQNQSKRLLTEDVLIGMYGFKIPLAFLVRGDRQGMTLSMGTWSPSNRERAEAGVLHSRQGILRSLLSGLYPAIDLAEQGTLLAPYPRLGLVRGIPTAKPAEAQDGALPIDRLVRALTGSTWAFLVLADPVDESVTADLRNQVINEIRTVHAAAEAMMAPSPLAEHYALLLDVLLKSLTRGNAEGAWRSAVYLMGDLEGYYRLASVWRGLYSGELSLPEPVRVWDLPPQTDLAAGWMLPEAPGPAAPGQFRYPFEYQTLLSSSQLASYVHLPQLETAGWSVNLVPDFDAVPPPVDGERLFVLGNVLHRRRETAAGYAINFDALTRHAFIAGVTGAGKTNTVFHILKRASEYNIPFMVVEPAKTEYRELLADPAAGSALTVFTLGNELAAPLRINPFEIMPGTQVNVHLDLLRSVFTSSYGMWTPLPQILETCLLGIYQDRGWDVTGNQNLRLGPEDDPADAFPTLSELVEKVDQVTSRLGYAEEFTSNARAALKTRLNGLRRGGKGLMFDVRRSFPIARLLSQPVVLELEGMGDDDDKAFLMGLLLIRLAQHRRSQGPQKTLQHLLVVEEAHRLLANTGGRGRQEEADPRGKAVEVFANLLSEIRAYGQGVIIADQVPVKLTPDAIKNTNLKITHRVVSQDDRTVLSGAMAMNPRQATALTTLGLGEAVAFTEGDDAPLLIRIPLAKGTQTTQPSIEQALEERWQALRREPQIAQVFQTYPTCGKLCPKPNRRCLEDRAIAESRQVAEVIDALLRSLLLSPSGEQALELLDAHLETVLQAILIPLREGSPRRMRCILTHGVYRFFEQRGAQSNWGFASVRRLTGALLPLLLAALFENDSDSLAAELGTLSEIYVQLCSTPGPFYGCQQACGSTCFHRDAVASFSGREEQRQSFRASARGAERGAELAKLGKQVCDQIFLPGVPPEYLRQAVLCYAIQQADAWRGLGFADRQTLVDEIVGYLEI